MDSSLWSRDEGVYLGYPSKDAFEIPSCAGSPLAYQDDRHIILLGPNGSGKSRRLLLPNLERLIHWSMLVVDPKGELYKMTHEHRRRGNGLPFAEHQASNRNSSAAIGVSRFSSATSCFGTTTSSWRSRSLAA